MKETFGKDRACGSRDMHVCVRAFITRHSYSLSSHEDRQTHTQTYSSLYFATAPAGEAITTNAQHN